MLELGSVDQTVVRRLRLAAGDLDPLAAGLRARSAFSSVTLGASGVGPRAVLCVRSLRDPRPRSCSFDPAGLRVPQVWRDRLGEDLSRLARAARRPAREAVPASAESVLFADTAELLAGLGADFCRGRAAEHWWWRSLLGQTPDARAVAAAWERWAAYAPAALELLSRQRAASAFALALPSAAAETIFLRVVGAHSLGELSRALTPHAADERTRADDAARLAYANFKSESDDGPATTTPWHAHAPEGAGAGPDAARQLLVGVSLMLVRAPSIVRRAEFARRVLLWSRRQSTAGPPRDAAPAPETAPRDDANETLDAADKLARRPTPDREPERRAAGDGARRPATSPTLNRDERAHSSRPDAASAGDARDDGGRASAQSDESAGERRESGRAAGAARGVEIGTRGGDEGVRRDAPEDATRARDVRAVSESGESPVDERVAESPPPLIEAEIETRFGGLFFLVNLGQYLGLYGDFTQPASPGIELPLWDFVALVGRKVAGPRVERDAVWALLARLACRDEREEPGARFEPSDEWRAAADWLKPFARDGGGPWLWSVEPAGSPGPSRSATSGESNARRRLRVLHPRGFFMIDVPLEVPATGGPGVESEFAREIEKGQLARELEPFGEFVGAAGPVRAPRGLSVPWRSARARWVGHVAAYARARLRLALGAETRGQIAHRLFERRARVCVTATHVDVLMRLADLPVEVRSAGLDRDPGWVPAAGRHVAFHFD